ncbi:hypothetical protein JTE90_004078, partial [Oedothorax gibbosus]
SGCAEASHHCSQLVKCFSVVICASTVGYISLVFRALFRASSVGYVPLVFRASTLGYQSSWRALERRRMI